MTTHDHEPQHTPEVTEPDTEAQVFHLPVERAEPADTAGAGEGEGEVIEGEIVEPPQVDQPEPRGTGSALARTEKREPILPSWAKDSQEFADTARWALGYAGHTAGFHAVRCPVYIARIIARVPQGTLRLLRGLARWLTDAEGRPVRNAAARREDATEYLKLSTQRDGRIRSRAVLTAGLGAAGIAAFLLGRAMLPELVQWSIVAAAIGGLGWLGAPADKPIASRAIEATRVPKLTSDAVTRALAALGISRSTRPWARVGRASATRGRSAAMARAGAPTSTCPTA